MCVEQTKHHNWRASAGFCNLGVALGRAAVLFCLMNLATGCALNRSVFTRSTSQTPAESNIVHNGAAVAAVPADCAAPSGVVAAPVVSHPQNQNTQQQAQQVTVEPTSAPPENSVPPMTQGQPQTVQPPGTQQPNGQMSQSQPPQAGYGPASAPAMQTTQGANVIENQPMSNAHASMSFPGTSVPSSLTMPPQASWCPPHAGQAVIPVAPVLAAELNQCQRQMAAMSEELESVKKRSDSTVMALEAMVAGQNRIYEENQRLRDAVAESDRRLREELEAADRNLEDITQIVDDVLSTASAAQQKTPSATRAKRPAPGSQSVPLPSVDNSL